MTSNSSPVVGLEPGEKPRRKLTDELNSSDDEYDERVLRSSPFSSAPATSSTPAAAAAAATPAANARGAGMSSPSGVAVITANNTPKKDTGDVFTPQNKKRKAKTSNRFESYQNVTDTIEFSSPDGTIERRGIDFDHKPIPVGSLVRVAKRTFPGFNKLGGVGKVKARNGTKEDNNLTYDVTYVLGGVETDIHFAYVVLDGAFGYTDTPRKRRASPTVSDGTKKKKKKTKKATASAKRTQGASPITSGTTNDRAAPRYRVGQVVEKFFKGYGKFAGKIAELPSEEMPYYRVKYEDGDAEDIHQDEISEYVVGAAFPGSSEARRLSNLGSTTAVDSIVKAEMLQKGARVVVDHQGSSYKATIRKVGGTTEEEEGRYLVHYAGQKQHITQWVNLSQIRGLICDEDYS